MIPRRSGPCPRHSSADVGQPQHGCRCGCVDSKRQLYARPYMQTDPYNRFASARSARSLQGGVKTPLTLVRRQPISVFIFAPDKALMNPKSPPQALTPDFSIYWLPRVVGKIQVLTTCQLAYRELGKILRSSTSRCHLRPMSRKQKAYPQHDTSAIQSFPHLIVYHPL